MRDTAALVLAGGINLSFSVLTHNRAKSALPFCGHFRVIDFVLTNLSRSGVRNVGVVIQYLPGSLIDHIGVGRAWDFDTVTRRIKLMPPFVGMGKTEWFRGSADAIHRNMNFASDHKADQVLIVCSDHIYSMDYRPMVALHRRLNADLTILTTRRPPETDPDHYGYVTVGENGRVAQFVEKPRAAPHETVSTGVYLFKADVLRERLEVMQEGSSHHLPTTVVEPLVESGRVYAYPFEGEWNHLPDVHAYVELHRRVLTGGSPVYSDKEQLLTDLRDRDLGSRPAPYFGPLSQVADSMVSPGCRVEGTVERSVLSPGVRVAPKAVVRDCILFHDCEVREGARLESVVSDKDVVYSAYCRVGGETESGGGDAEGRLPELGDLTVVGKGARILPGARIGAGHEIGIDRTVGRKTDPRGKPAKPAVAVRARHTE